MKTLASMRFKRTKTGFAPLFIVTAGIFFGASAFAQPGRNNGGGNGGGNRPDFSNMTPEQRDAMQSQQRERTLRMQLTRAGFDDTALQDTVVAYVKARENARTLLVTAANKVGQALANTNMDDVQFDALWDNFETALDTEKVRLKTAEADLDTKIKYSADKRLTATLTLAGVIGDASTYLPAPRGQGGGPGGRRGGQDGGQGGPMDGGPPPGGMGGGPDGGPPGPPPEN